MMAKLRQIIIIPKKLLFNFNIYLIIKTKKEMSDQLPRIKFSEKILKLLKELEDNDSYIAFEILYMSEPK